MFIPHCPPLFSLTIQRNVVVVVVVVAVVIFVVVVVVVAVVIFTSYLLQIYQILAKCAVKYLMIICF